MEKQIHEDDLVLCTVEGIDGTTVFVRVEENNQRGTIITSEIAPGRIRNIRDYVMPNKKIVCKVLRISGDRIDLSLRRVSSKEKTEVLEKYSQEQTAKSILKALLKEKYEDAEKSLLEKFESISDFFNKAREDEKILAQYIPKDLVEQFKKILVKRKKVIEVKKIIRLKCLEQDGIKRIKKILENKDEKIKITYLAAGKFQVDCIGEDYKKANQAMTEFLEKAEKQAKSNLCEFILEEKN